ncbi:MAG: nitroreductase family protein [Olpidium bornovanus]|uniref:Nitroreductase family protein n=1 Tax=Olpidium bornovanus TaxID=278681 RepID=A0A8H7ZUP2_9FUNG|nr:MAG: nitroreductase family protein [Olpidium bornovanus]
MSVNYLTAVKARRTFYNITKNCPIPSARVVEIVKEAVLHTPSSFNSQSGRALVLFGKEHDKLWDGVKVVLKPLTSEEKYPETVNKIDGSFKAGYGTVLFFEDQRPIQAMQQKFPAYQGPMV